jgi:hypothetical protein
MRSRLTLLLALLVATPAVRAEPLIFSAIGCGPYKPAEEPLLERYVALVGADGKSEFLIHLGDIVSGAKKTWPEAQYAKVADILRKAKLPVFVVPGDNEWNDLDDPARGWKYWEKHFLQFDKQFGYQRPVRRQQVRPENMAWTSKGVLLIGLNLVGGRVHDKAEWARRMQDDADWVRESMARDGGGVRAAVVFAQTKPMKEQESFFKDFAAAVGKWGKPVLFLHADGHVWQEEPRFMATPNLLRVQTDQLGSNPPLLVTVSDEPDRPFVFDRRIAPKEK